jgi:hypothetical protein
MTDIVKKLGDIPEEPHKENFYCCRGKTTEPSLPEPGCRLLFFFTFFGILLRREVTPALVHSYP